MTACCLSTLRDWRDTEALRWPPGRGPRGRDPTGGPASTHPAQVTPHQAARLTAHASQSRLHTSVCAPPQKAHAGQTQPARAAPRSLGFLPHQPAALGPPSVASGHQLASTHCPPRHCSWGSVGRAGHPRMLRDRLFTPKGLEAGGGLEPKGRIKGTAGGSGSPNPHPTQPVPLCTPLGVVDTRTHAHALPLACTRLAHPECTSGRPGAT